MARIVRVAALCGVVGFAACHLAVGADEFSIGTTSVTTSSDGGASAGGSSAAGQGGAATGSGGSRGGTGGALVCDNQQNCPACLQRHATTRPITMPGTPGECSENV